MTLLKLPLRNSYGSHCSQATDEYNLNPFLVQVTHTDSNELVEVINNRIRFQQVSAASRLGSKTACNKIERFFANVACSCLTDVEAYRQLTNTPRLTTV